MAKQSNYTVPVSVESVIHTVRGHKVILDTDLARIYGVEIRRLNEQVKRNTDRFPDDFMFRLTPDEWEKLRRLRSQNATLKRGQHRKYPPYAFTEHGALMAANILKSKTAVSMSIYVVRAFIRPLLLSPPEKQRKRIYPVKLISPPSTRLHYENGAINL